ncbi:MAG: DegV family protein [Dehalococcoidia bacterium]
MVRQRKVAVVTDSSCCLARGVIEEYEISVVPFELVFDDRVYLDGVDVQPAEFYKLLSRNHRLPTTSAPKPGSFLEAFQEVGQRAESILCLTLAQNFSTTFQAARMAAETASSLLPGVPIRVMDTRTAAGAEGFLVLEAARAAQRGEELEQAAQRVEALIPRLRLYAFLDTLHYLWKGGRIPKIAAWAGSLLGVKPLMELRLGEARLLEKPRSRSKAMERLIALTKRDVGDQPLHGNVMHANALADAEALSQWMRRELNCVELLISEFTPVMGTHTGPGLLGIAFYCEQ